MDDVSAKQAHSASQQHTVDMFLRHYPHVLSLQAQVNLYKHEHNNIAVGSCIPFQDQLSLSWQPWQG